MLCFGIKLKKESFSVEYSVNLYLGLGIVDGAIDVGKGSEECFACVLGAGEFTFFVKVKGFAFVEEFNLDDDDEREFLLLDCSFENAGEFDFFFDGIVLAFFEE